MENKQQTNLNDPQSEKNFESAFARLEEILERMNSGAISLDESLKLYEEADCLVNMCSKRLNDAERKIEILIKNRNGDLALNAEQKPITQDFTLPQYQNPGKKQPN